MDEGSTTTLECQVSGHPEPAVRWYKEGRPLSASQKVEIRKQDGRVRLIIYGVKEHDSGRYTCIAQNHLGENSSSANVIVNGRFILAALCLVYIIVVIIYMHWLQLYDWTSIRRQPIAIRRGDSTTIGRRTIVKRLSNGRRIEVKS